MTLEADRETFLAVTNNGVDHEDLLAHWDSRIHAGAIESGRSVQGNFPGCAKGRLQAP